MVIYYTCTLKYSENVRGRPLHTDKVLIGEYLIFLLMEDERKVSSSESEVSDETNSSMSASEFFDSGESADSTSSDDIQQEGSQNETGEKTNESDTEQGGESDWTTVSIKQETKESLDNFVDKAAASSKDEVIRLLLELSAEINLEGGEESLSGTFSDEGTPVEIQGVRSRTGDGKTKHIGFSVSDSSVLISSTSPSDSLLQPLRRAQYTRAIIYCPACGSQIGFYDLNRKYPPVTEGSFNEMTIWCSVCDSERPEYTLFATQQPGEVTQELLSGAMKQYISHVLIGEQVSQQEWNSRVDHVHQLVSDAGWDWLIDPKLWIGFQATGGVEVTPRLFVNFLAQYLEYQLEYAVDVASVDSEVIDVTDSADEYWLVQVDVNHSDGEEVKSYIENLFEAWESVTASVSEREPEGFASDRFTVQLPLQKSLQL